MANGGMEKRVGKNGIRIDKCGIGIDEFDVELTNGIDSCQRNW
jgi:hypothetical protein